MIYFVWILNLLIFGLINILNLYKFVFVISVKVMVNGKIEDLIIRIYFLLILFIIFNVIYIRVVKNDNLSN